MEGKQTSIQYPGVLHTLVCSASVSGFTGFKLSLSVILHFELDGKHIMIKSVFCYSILLIPLNLHCLAQMYLSGLLI